MSIILKLCVQCIHCNEFCILFSAMCHIITIYKPVKQLHHTYYLCYADIFFIFSYRTIHYCTFGREYNELYGICHRRHWRSRVQHSTSCYIFSFFVHAPRREHNGVVFILLFFYFVRTVQAIIYIFIQRELYHNVQALKTDYSSCTGSSSYTAQRSWTNYNYIHCDRILFLVCTE